MLQAAISGEAGRASPIRLLLQDQVAVVEEFVFISHIANR